MANKDTEVFENGENEVKKIPKEYVWKKFSGELKDMLIGAAFPFMLMLILSATVISFVGYSGEDDIALRIVILIVGEVMIAGANIIFGKQNGATAYRKTFQNGNKRKVKSSDLNARLYIGEYAPVKGIIIPLISCVPFVIFQIIGAAYPNDVCKFALMYVFGWAYFPFTLGGLSPWLNLLTVLPFAGVHFGAYIWGADKERKKIEKVSAAEAGTEKKEEK